MHMYLPFLLAFLIALATLWGKQKLALWSWALLLIVTITTFVHHVTMPLPLTF